MAKSSQAASGFGRPWCALMVAFARHVFDEATRAFHNVYNPTVIAMWCALRIGFPGRSFTASGGRD